MCRCDPLTIITVIWDERGVRAAGAVLIVTKFIDGKQHQASQRQPGSAPPARRVSFRRNVCPKCRAALAASSRGETIPPPTSTLNYVRTWEVQVKDRGVAGADLVSAEAAMRTATQPHNDYVEAPPRQ